MMTTVTKWTKEHEFISHQAENEIHLDGSMKNGFSPKALLLAAVAACSGIDVVDILAKMRVDLESLEIETSATQTEEHPKVFNEVTLLYRVKAPRQDEEKIIKAVDLSMEKYCGVSAMLKKNSPVLYRIEFV